MAGSGGRADRSSRCELVAVRSMQAILAGQSAGLGSCSSVRVAAVVAHSRRCTTERRRPRFHRATGAGIGARSSDALAGLLRSDDLPATQRLLPSGAPRPQAAAMEDPAHIPATRAALPPPRCRLAGHVQWGVLLFAGDLASALYLPDGFTPAEWRRCCAQASIHELGLIHRDPRNALDSNWIARDPDREPLRRTATGENWMAFIGLRPARPDDVSSLMRPCGRCPALPRYMDGLGGNPAPRLATGPLHGRVGLAQDDDVAGPGLEGAGAGALHGAAAAGDVGAASLDAG